MSEELSMAVPPKRSHNRTTTLKCGKCSNGVVHCIVAERQYHVTVSIQRCSSCLHQYYIKELVKNPLTELNRPSPPNQ